MVRLVDQRLAGVGRLPTVGGASAGRQSVSRIAKEPIVPNLAGSSVTGSARNLLGTGNGFECSGVWQVANGVGLQWVGCRTSSCERFVARPTVQVGNPRSRGRIQVS